MLNPQAIEDLNPEEQAEFIAWAIRADKQTAKELLNQPDMTDAEWDKWADEHAPTEPKGEPPCYDELDEAGNFRTVRETGFQTEQCTKCGREVSDQDPDARYKHGEIIACMQCTERQTPKRLTSAEKQITFSVARRYERRYETAYIVGNAIDTSAWLYRQEGNVHKVIAEIPPMDTEFLPLRRKCRRCGIRFIVHKDKHAQEHWTLCVQCAWI